MKNEVSIKPNENTKRIIKSSERIPAIKKWIKKTFRNHQQVFFRYNSYGCIRNAITNI